MSAPQTNIEKQERRHKGPLFGVVAAAIVALSGLIVWLLVYEGEQPGAAGVSGTEQAAPKVENATGTEAISAD